MFRFKRLLWAGAVALLAPAAGLAQDLTVYDDAVQNGFQDYSYGGGSDFSSTTQVHGGTRSIAFIGDGFNAVSFHHDPPAFTTAQYPTLHFWVHGGAAGGQQLRLYLQLSGGIVANAPLGTYIAGGSITAGAWREVTVPFATAPLSYSGSFDRIDLQNDLGGNQPILYIDDVSLVAGGPPPANLMQIDHDVTVASMLSDRFTWNDGAGKPRVAVLAHNDTASVNGSHGGALREFRYQMPDNSTRVADVTTYGNGGYGGFGYVVSHRGDGTVGIAGDDSPLGFVFAGTFQRVFEGRHHAIFRFTQMYPRYSSQAAVPPNTLYNVPVTIDWIFSTGRDNPVWAVTWDLSSVPANSLNDDSRAPYGELNIDGVGATDIDGVGWGDRYKFFSTTAPVTLSSTWNWTQPNTIPYVKLWITGTDATIGTVQTQTLQQQDAGAGRNHSYHDLTGNWGFTSAHGNAGEDVMPWQDSWPFQANSFSIVSAPNSNNNARLTWGAMYGFLGQASYTTYNGLVTTSSGWPKKSYSTYVVLGTHSSSPVEAQVTHVETVQSLTLTAAIGSVVTSGPAGVARLDNVTYAPAGYNHVYGALAFIAGGNQLDANIAVGAGTLRKPLLVLGNYTAGVYPPTVKLGGVALVSDVDYFPSLRTDASELWITLNRDLTGAVNRLEILSSACAPVPAPTIQASGPTAFCAGGNVTLTASIAPGAGVSYLWSPGAPTTQAVNVTASGSYSVTVTVNGCAGTSPATVVTVNPIPATPVIVAPAGAAPMEAGLTASVTLHAGSTYAWGITNGTITADQGTSQITFTAGGVGPIGLSVIETSPAGCSSAQAVASVTVAAGAVRVDVDPNLDRRPVSPLIFGVNFGDGAQLAQMHWPVRRWGGTPTSRYNWQIDVANSGNDWFFLNDVRPPDAAGSSADVFIDETRAAGSEPFMTVPTLGWTARDRTNRYGFSIAKYGAQQLNECDLQAPPNCNSDMGNGMLPDGVTPVLGNDPADTSVVAGPSLVTGWKTHIAARTGTAGTGGVKYFGLDNEPMLWDYAHRDVHPNGTTYDEHWTKGRDIAAALKLQDPAVQIIGPNEWGWCGWLDSSADYNAPGGSCFVLGPDAAAHGSMPFSAWWLAQAKAYDVAHGIRIVDTFSLHFYPQGNAITFSDVNGDTPATQALRLRSLKELYDRNWTSESWIGDNGGKIYLIPRMRDWISASYPGTKLAIGEYNFGDVGVSSALAQAEALAIFGREGVDMALRWEAPPPSTVIEDAFRIYMNYDGAGSKVAGDSIRAVSSNVDAVGGYALRDTGAFPGRLYVLLFNKDIAATSTTVSIAGQTIQSPVSLWRFPDPVTGRLGAAGTVVPAVASFTLSLPARSATLAVVDLAPCSPVPSTPVITAPGGATPGQAGLTASVTSHAGSTWAWSVTSGSITAGNGSSQITFTAGAAGTLGLSVVETNASGCASATGTASVNVAAAPPAGIAFYALTPCRLFDTRNATGPDAAAPALSSLGTRTIAIGGRCGLPLAAKSLSVNMTITGAAAAGTLLLYPADLGSAPLATSISFRAGQTRANNDLLLLAGDGTGFKVLNGSAGSVHFILDVNGWFE